MDSVRGVIDPYITTVSANEQGDAGYAMAILAIRSLVETPLELDSRVSFFVGDNGSGKSTLVEAIAVASKLNAEAAVACSRSTSRRARRTRICTRRSS